MLNNGFSTENRQCPVCGTRFEGRTDKRYCSDQCRVTHNRHHQRQAEAPLLEVLSILRHNRTVLKSLCPGKKAQVSREKLEALRFNPEVFSSIHVNAYHTYFFCGDFGFQPFQAGGKDMALIIRREPYATSLDPWESEIDKRSRNTGRKRNTLG